MGGSALDVEQLRIRYGHAYKIALGIVRFGNVVKIGGVLVGVIMLALTLNGNDHLPDAMITVQAVYALLVGLTGFISGWLIWSGGQLAQVLIDIAVNTSPLLDNIAKAETIGKSL